MTTASPTIVASSGKVLIAGGYLVLDPAHAGLVVSTSSSFFTAIASHPAAAPGLLGLVRVRAPQFVDATWLYHVQLRGNDLLVLPAQENKSQNKFIFLALQKTLALVSEIKGTEYLLDLFATRTLDITIVGDNDFYSQRQKLESQGLSRSLASLESLQPFQATGTTLSAVHKTGLGSSAALITSLISALLLHTGIITPDDFQAQVVTDGKRLAHHLAQYVHCLAQGKIGSGFDVSAAVFGSQIYTRFDPGVIEGLMKDSNNLPLLPTLSPANPKWDYHVKPFSLPPLTRLLLADVDAGSDTPSLVGTVLRWRQEQPDQASKLWKSIDALNVSLGDALAELSRIHAEDEKHYVAALRFINSVQPVQWLGNPMMTKKNARVVEAFYNIHKITQEIRAGMREMGTLSGVPIEPRAQTRLLDACMGQAGVIGGGVPGAGGYDALWVLVCDLPAESIVPDMPAWRRVEHVWQNWNDEAEQQRNDGVSLVATPLLAGEQSKSGGMRVVSNIEEVRGLREALGW